MRWWIPPLLAVQFLTRIPVPGLSRITTETAKTGLAKSVVWFPSVGALVGAITAAVLISADHIWPRVISVVLALIFEARLTGAFHEDAVADFCDGFGGGMTPDRIHDIMKDSRIGSYGALGMGLAVALRATLLTVVPDALLLPTLVASAAFGRYLAVCLMMATPPLNATPGLAKDIGAKVSIMQWLVATLLTLFFMIPFGLASPQLMISAVFAAFLFILWFNRFLMRHLGGVTGDCLGFGVYAGQLIILLAATASIR
jgi:adenosylcobinamide-GDP ribazoletransferase